MRICKEVCRRGPGENPVIAHNVVIRRVGDAVPGGRKDMNLG